jgi:glycosyltransferase involved in cell wall biosynthesis
LRADLRPQLHLVGEGRLRTRLESIARALGIEDSVEFLGPRTDVLDRLQRAWGFVLPSRWEGMPNALLEAMACAVPCVATRVSGSEDIIDDGIDGRLVSSECPKQLAEALGHIILDTDLALRLGRAGRDKVEHNYQLTSVVDQSLELYRRLLA